jgi:hypothetical protein
MQAEFSLPVYEQEDCSSHWGLKHDSPGSRLRLGWLGRIRRQTCLTAVVTCYKDRPTGA